MTGHSTRSTFAREQPAARRSATTPTVTFKRQRDAPKSSTPGFPRHFFIGSMCQMFLAYSITALSDEK